MNFACIQQYFDNGKVKAFVQPATANIKQTYESRDDYDFYVDLFETKDAADDWAREARKA